MRNLVKWLTVVSTVVALVVVVTGCGSTTSTAPVQKQSPAAFYKGKTLTIIVPYGPGGGYDQWARLISPYMQKYLGVDKVEVVNSPGGGGLVGTNKIYSAQPDGLTIGDTNAAGDVFDQIDHAPGANFDVNKFNWLGRPDDDPHIIAVHPKGPYHSFADLLKTKVPLKSLATGKGSSDYNAAVITWNAFKVPFTMVAAFSGSKDEKAAFLSGNGDTMSVSASDIAQIAQQAEVVVVIATQPLAKLPNVPTVMDLAASAKIPGDNVKALQGLAGVMDLGHAFFAPPGVPADRVAALQKAFQQSLADPAFVAAAEKAKLWVGYASADDLQRMTQTAFGQAALFQPLLRTK